MRHYPSFLCDNHFFYLFMSRPPLTTLVLEGIPPKATEWLMGIDSQFFLVSQLLRGIKSIPSGIHLFHYSVPTEGLSLRYGYWFDCIEGDLFVVRWDQDDEKLIMNNPREATDKHELLNHSKVADQLGDIYSRLIEYPENANNWFGNLANYIDFEILMEFLPYKGSNEIYVEEINTMMPSKEENLILADTLLKKDPNTKIEDQSNNELKYTIIEFMKNRHQKEQKVETITQEYLDKSWYLEELFGHDHELLFGELQLAFLNFVILGSFCSGLQWLNLLKLLQSCDGFIKRNQTFALNFLKIFESQLNLLPPEYLSVDSFNSIDLQSYVKVMEGFSQTVFLESSWNNGDCCGRMKLGGLIIEKWINIKIIHKSRFGIDLNALKERDNDGEFEVYNLSDYDENDEDAPAIVS